MIHTYSLLFLVMSAFLQNFILTMPESTSKCLLVLSSVLWPIEWSQTIADFWIILGNVVTQPFLTICPLLGEILLWFCISKPEDSFFIFFAPDFRHMIYTLSIRCSLLNSEENIVRKMLSIPNEGDRAGIEIGFYGWQNGGCLSHCILSSQDTRYGFNV